MGNHCTHSRASNAELDFVVDGIVSGKYLFAPCEATGPDGKRFRQWTEILDGETHKLLTYRKHSQEAGVFLVRCQRCAQGSLVIVGLNRIYKRMIERGVIHPYPPVKHIDGERNMGFGYNVIVFPKTEGPNHV